MTELLEVLFEIILEFALSPIAAGRRKKKQRLSFQERLQRARQKRINRALRRYLRRGDDGWPIPGIGLTCRQCSYSLTGLTNRVCPECGNGFQLEDFIVESA